MPGQIPLQVPFIILLVVLLTIAVGIAAVLGAARRLWAGGPSQAGNWSLWMLKAGESGVGVIAAGPGAPAAVDQDYLNAVLNQAAVALERMRLAAAIEDARVEAKTETLREALLNSISHDLQTPLAAILGSATALQGFGDRGDSGARAELIATIREEAERLSAFIDNILDLSRITAGHLSPRLELIELADIVNSAVRRMRKKLAGHQVEIDLPRDLPMVHVDPFLMEHALANLLDNAAKYSPADSRIRVAAASDGDDVCVDVTDSGTGIAPEDLDRVFDVFFRGQTTDMKPAGAGLGLAICRAFVEANGGTIEIMSKGLARGTTCRIRMRSAVSVGLDAAVPDE